jgi:hypothetical protein
MTEFASPKRTKVAVSALKSGGISGILGHEWRNSTTPTPGCARELLVEHTDVRRQQAMEIERVPLSLGEGRTLVQEGIIEKVVAGERR